MTSAEKNLDSTVRASQEEKPETLPPQQALMQWRDALAMPERTVEEMDVKLLKLKQILKSREKALKLAEETLKELEKSEVRPLTQEEIDELRRESRQLLEMYS